MEAAARDMLSDLARTFDTTPRLEVLARARRRYKAHLPEGERRHRENPNLENIRYKDGIAFTYHALRQAIRDQRRVQETQPAAPPPPPPGPAGQGKGKNQAMYERLQAEQRRAEAYQVEEDQIWFNTLAHLAAIMACQWAGEGNDSSILPPIASAAPPTAEELKEEQKKQAEPEPEAQPEPEPTQQNSSRTRRTRSRARTGTGSRTSTYPGAWTGQGGSSKAAL
jgi:hypothetical protein